MSHRWLGYDESLDFWGLLCSCHDLGPSVYHLYQRYLQLSHDMGKVMDLIYTMSHPSLQGEGAPAGRGGAAEANNGENDDGPPPPLIDDSDDEEEVGPGEGPPA